MPQVFVSYDRRDTPNATRLVAALEEWGFDLYWDRKLTGGQRFSTELQRQIRRSRCVLVLWSRAARSSNWVIAEALEAFNLNKLISVLLQDVDLPVPFNGVQAVKLSGWRGGPKSPQLHELVEAVSKALGLVPSEKSTKSAGPPRALLVSARAWREYRKALRSSADAVGATVKALEAGLPQAAVEVTLLSEYYEALARRVILEALGQR